LYESNLNNYFQHEVLEKTQNQKDEILNLPQVVKTIASLTKNVEYVRRSFWFSIDFSNILQRN